MQQRSAHVNPDVGGDSGTVDVNIDVDVDIAIDTGRIWA